MSAEGRLVTVGRVGRAHGRDGSFWVEGAERGEARDLLAEGSAIEVAGRRRSIERRAGTEARPLVRLSAIESRDEAAALRGEPLLAAESEVPLGPGE